MTIRHPVTHSAAEFMHIACYVADLSIADCADIVNHAIETGFIDTLTQLAQTKLTKAGV